MTVTTVDSGSKALKFLGFHEDEESKMDQEHEHISLSPKKKVS